MNALQVGRRNVFGWLFCGCCWVWISTIAYAQSFQWAVRGGGTGRDTSHAIALDALENSYITGEFEGTATFGSFTLSSVGQSDVFVAKYNGAGGVLWARKGAGADWYDESYDIAIDGSENSYITGCYFGTATSPRRAATGPSTSMTSCVCWAASATRATVPTPTSRRVRETVPSTWTTSWPCWQRSAGQTPAIATRAGRRRGAHDDPARACANVTGLPLRRVLLRRFAGPFFVVPQNWFSSLRRVLLRLPEGA